jgi:general secretion pathway protein G
MLHPNHRRAFSLIELVIVVVIIGVLAAIAIPRMSSGADNAKNNAVKANLAVLRQAIELHKAEVGTFPTVGGFPDDLQPYLRVIPKLGVGNNANANSVGTTTATAATPPTAEAGTNGWLYNATTGDIFANADGYLLY